jgi:FlaA1/EpsC-like NDP-sugar epimerase
MKNFNLFLSYFLGIHLKRQRLTAAVFLISCVTIVFTVSNIQSIEDNWMELALFFLLHAIVLLISGTLRYLPGYIDFNIAISVLIAHMLAPCVYGLLLFFTEGSFESFIIAAVFSSLWTFVHCAMLINRNPQKKEGITIGVYGAGIAGRELVSIMKQGSRYTPKYFIDDDENLLGCIHSGLPVYDWESIKNKWDEFRVDMICVSIPSMDAEQRTFLLEKVSDLSVIVRFLPHVDELIDSQVSLSQLRAVKIDDILNRSEVSLSFPSENNTLEGKTALVTGGGGSIGLELCKQLINARINRLVLIDHSEFAIVEAEKVLEDWLLDHQSDVRISYELGTVLDNQFLEAVFQDESVDFVFHAAAYKHVPMVEINSIEAIENNTIGTINLLDVSEKYQVENFSLISTDKAVRPTNIMGASKRLAELILQAKASELKKIKNNTIFSIIRFGNVLGSSGSVVPLFYDQIKKGGPLTITHKEITRYFMTIKEAATLVLHSTKIARGNQVFILDMGKSIRILDLAKRMIKLSGLKERNANNTSGDIEIKIIGLRPGEKLHEELTLSKKIKQTSILNILEADEEFFEISIIQTIVSNLREAIKENNSGKLKDILINADIGYRAKIND